MAMGPRVTERERLKHKVLIRLNDDLYSLLLDEACNRGLAPSIVARLAFARGLPAIRRKRQSGCRGKRLCQAQRDG